MHDNAALMPVGPIRPDLRKPATTAPLYWRWDAFKQWLLKPVEGKQSPAILGHHGPLQEHRLHVSMNPDTLSARTGALFETSGLEFAAPGADLETRLSKAQRLALAVVVDRKEAPTLHNDLAHLGGERRLVSWRRGNRQLPDCPAEVLDAIREQKACRVILLTPAYLTKGYQPTRLLKPQDDVKPELQAIAIRQPQVVSGWRLEPPSGPKPTRRLAPAGTVFFLSLTSENPRAIENWVKERWMQCISDDEEALNDGFGLAVLGTWCGTPHVMEEVKEE
jgi:CRISPR-associated protein Cmr3